MKRHVLALLALLFLGLALRAAPEGYPPSSDRASFEKFFKSHFLSKTSPPFRFVYDGKDSRDFLGRWDALSNVDRTPDGAVVRIAYHDPATKLAVTVQGTRYDDFPVVEWVVRFKNGGDADTRIIGDVRACAIDFDGWTDGPLTLYRARGSSAERTDFAPVTDVLAEKSDVRFGPSAGRSSDTNALPFFNLAGSRHGVVAAVGWSGQWSADVARPDGSRVALEAGQARTHFVLHPGEEVRTPSIALLFWSDADRMAGHNLFRRFVLAHHTPRPGGRPLALPLCSGVGFGGPFPCNEYACATESYVLAMMDRLSQFGLAPDACWIDAGWYENAHKTWWTGVGNWTVNRENFPRGLKPVTDAAHGRGQGFVLWFEPERVYEGTRLDREHPEWLAALPGNPNRLLNLGDEKALSWLTGYVADFLLGQGITIFRQDFNFDPAPYWQAMDASDRVGIAEMKHVAGLYAFWDGLLARVPGLLIDNCASGGRRIDLETIGRSIPLWRTDYSYFEPTGYQCHTYGLHFFLPCSGTGNNDPDAYHFRSAYGGAIVTGWDLNASFNLPQAQADFAEFRDLRPYFLSDYYPLTPYSTGDDAWAAFEWNRPETRDGIVVAFRRPQSVGATISVALKGLDPQADYRLTFEDYGLSVVKSGRELEAGFEVKVPSAPGSLVVKYQAIGR